MQLKSFVATKGDLMAWTALLPPPLLTALHPCSLDAFSIVLHRSCSERELMATPDVAHLLSMSVVMLNTRCEHD